MNVLRNARGVLIEPRGTHCPVSEFLELRTYGLPSRPALIYLPGLHGDWTIIGGFRRALGECVRFVEMNYPRTLTWSLDDYASAIVAGLRANGVEHGWLLGESFGSQIGWAMLARGDFAVDGVILAGGFVRHPSRLGVQLVTGLAGGIPLNWLVRILFGYAHIKQFRYRHSVEAMNAIREFLARRTELDRQAAKHRLGLVARYDPSAIARQARVPIYALTGAFDPVVPWWPVRRWLRKNCPALRDYKVIWPAEHNVLSGAPEATAQLVLQWMGLG